MADNCTPEARRIRHRFAKGIKDFDLIAAGDTVLVGLSGGKDSLALVKLLGQRRRKYNFNFRVVALHVRMANVEYRSDLLYLQDFCTACDVEFIVREGHFLPDRNPKRSPCFLCSWNRRKILFETAREIGAQKIALGHHQDDILHTALMNLCYEGAFSTMPVRLKLRKIPLTIIRPLCLVREYELTEWAKQEGFRPVDKICPFDTVSRRTDMRRLFQQMEDGNPELRFSLWHALEAEHKLVEE